MKKTKRIHFRATPQVKAYVDELADRLHTNPSDMLVVGAVLVERAAKCPADYLRLKADTIAELASVARGAVA